VIILESKWFFIYYLLTFSPQFILTIRKKSRSHFIPIWSSIRIHLYNSYSYPFSNRNILFTTKNILAICKGYFFEQFSAGNKQKLNDVKNLNDKRLAILNTWILNFFKLVRLNHIASFCIFYWGEPIQFPPKCWFHIVKVANLMNRPFLLSNSNTILY